MAKPSDHPSHILVHRPKITGERIIESGEFDCVYTHREKIFVGHQHSIARVGGDLRYSVDDQNEKAREWLKGTVAALRDCLRRVVENDEREAVRDAAK